LTGELANLQVVNSAKNSRETYKAPTAPKTDKELLQKLHAEKDYLTPKQTADSARHWESGKIQTASAVDAT